jgi:hypothetical protein
VKITNVFFNIKKIYMVSMDPEVLSILKPKEVYTRRSRMVRKPTGKRIELTQRDLQIFDLLTRYRFLRSTHLHALASGKSRKRFIERLGDLYHEGGYLERPDQQWQAINARYMPVVYELGAAGRTLLAQYGVGKDAVTMDSGWNGGRPGRHFQHELMICDILSSIEIGTRGDPRIRFISWPEIMANPKMPERTRRAAKPLAARVPVTYTPAGSRKAHRSDRALLPDALFGLEYRTRSAKKYRFFALEADRNTQPIVRRDLQQSSYLRKILQYREVIAQSAYKTLWGLPNLMVLTVTTNDRHRQNIMRLAHEVTAGKGSPVLLFNTMPSLTSLEKAPLPTPEFLTEPWLRVGHPDFFIERP